MQTSERSKILSKLQNLELENFDALARDVWEYQCRYNPLYGKYVRLLGESRSKRNLPFLPIQFFKSHSLRSGEWGAQCEFSSSGTTGQVPSRHLVRDLGFYHANAIRGFEVFWGDVREWCILALLPSYLERQGSSLVAMAEHFMSLSKHSESGFYLRDFDGLQSQLRHCQRKGCPTLLLGVSFALLDFAETHSTSLEGIHIMETGGMKGRRAELTRAELHERLKTGFQIDRVYSEYGMTELFSQAYVTPKSKGRFLPSPTMRVVASEPNDPFAEVPFGRTGVLNIIDLANVDTCAFIATEDLGKVWEDGSFEVIGRLDAAELRGCNLLFE
jgi:hypothetical protein